MIKVCYNVMRLHEGTYNNLAKTGIYRYTYDLLLNLLSQEHIQVISSLIGHSNILDSYNYYRYLNKNPLSIFNNKYINIESKYRLYFLYFLYETIIRKNFPKKLVCYSDKLIRILAKLDTQSVPFPQDADIFHSTLDPLPPCESTGKAKRILTIHDIIAKKFPQFFTEPYWRWMDRTLESINLEQDWIISDSECTKKDIIEFLNINPDHVVVVPLACSNIFHKIEDDTCIKETLKKYHLNSKEYYISVATIEPRKNIRFLIETFCSLLSNPCMKNKKLLLVGSIGWGNVGMDKLCENISDKQKQSIIFTGFIPDEHIVHLYNGALGSIYISLYEGFGLPILEAMQCGIPVITSNLSSMPEVAGEAGIYVDPQDSDSVGAAIIKLAEDNNFRKSMRQKAKNRASVFSWQRTAKETIAVYQKALASR
ncbi:glycosyltransferase family 4 protein [Planctomycetota bacterium]